MKKFTLADLIRVVEACTGTENITAFDDGTADTLFSELGVDSLAVYELATRLQDELGIPIPDEAIEAMRTPRLLLRYVNDQLMQTAN